MTRANRVISLDLGWSEAIESQAFDRVHRLGQTRPVTVERLVISGTVEDRILALQEQKKNLADGSLGEGNGKKIGREYCFIILMIILCLTRISRIDCQTTCFPIQHGYSWQRSQLISPLRLTRHNRSWTIHKRVPFSCLHDSRTPPHVLVLTLFPPITRFLSPIPLLFAFDYALHADIVPLLSYHFSTDFNMHVIHGLF